MKKLFLTSLIAVLFVFNIQAQEYGGGIAYGTEIEKVAFNLTANFKINDNIIVSSYANLFAPDKVEAGGSTICSAMTTVNLDGNYRFFLSDNFSLYPLAGFNYSRIGSVQDGEALEASHNFGANLGAGAKLNEFVLEGKYVTGDAGQLVLTLAYVIDFDEY